MEAAEDNHLVTKALHVTGNADECRFFGYPKELRDRKA